MEIRKKISLQFTFIVAIILFLSLLTIYLSFSNFRKEDFYSRLENKARSIGKILLEIEEISPELLEKIERNNPTALSNEILVVFNENGDVIYHTNYYDKIRIPSEIKTDLHNKKEIKFVDKKFEIYGYSHQGKSNKISVFCGAIDVFGKGKLKKLGVILSLVFVIGIVIIHFAGRWFASKALLPILEVINEVDNINISNINLRLKEGTGKDEIAKLASTFNKLLERLESAFKIQKNFISNASHELRTPLTAITGQLEVVLMKERSNNEYRQALLSILEDIENLNILANKLLTLARASGDFSDESFHAVRIDEIIWKARANVLKSNQNYKINIHFEGEFNDEKFFIINGNEHLLKSAISNLMENGCKYSDNHTTQVVIKKVDIHINLTFKDEGVGIPKNELKKIFEPFHRAGNVSHIKGHGVGLSLVNKIINLHSGNIKINSTEKIGTEIIISFPIQSVS